VDDFHNPPDLRYRRGRLSPEGYYRDAFDCSSLLKTLLLPLGPGGSMRYRAGSFGQPDGAPAEYEERTATDDAILIVDGVFLFRPELNDCWDFRVFIDADIATTMERGIARDAGRMGSAEEARRRYEQRYVPGERLYLESVRPWELADVVVQVP
jgi:uridine kinase